MIYLFSSDKQLHRCSELHTQKHKNLQKQNKSENFWITLKTIIFSQERWKRQRENYSSSWDDFQNRIKYSGKSQFGNNNFFGAEKKMFSQI